MITLKDIGRLIQEEVKLTLEADTRLFHPGERLALDRARQRKGDNLTAAEREVIQLAHAPPTSSSREDPDVEPPADTEDLASRVRQQTAAATDHKPVETQDVAAFKMYRKLHYDLLDLTEDQRHWLAGHAAGMGTVPREVLRQEVPDILDAIEAVERNEVDPELQARLSQTQSAPKGETAEEEQARKFQYNRASREFNLWRDAPYRDLNRWLSTSRGLETAIEYNVIDVGGFDEVDFPGGEEAAQSFKQTFDDKIAIEQHLFDKGYNMEQLSYYLQDPEGLYGDA
jgi:hypothetical protein